MAHKAVFEIGRYPWPVNDLPNVTHASKRDPALETVSKIKEVLARARLAAPIVLHGTENTVWELLDEALRSGYDVRIGFEDTLKLPDGETAPNNGALIREAQRRIAILHSRRLAGCDGTQCGGSIGAATHARRNEA